MSTTADLPTSFVRMWKTSTGDVSTTGKATAWWYGPYTGLSDFLKAVGGKPELVGGAMRIVPLVFPDLAFPIMYADHVAWQGIGHNHVAAPNGNYSHVKVQVDFQSFNYSTFNDIPYASIELEPDGRHLNGTPSGFVYNGTAINPQSDIGLFIGGFALNVTLYRLPSVNINLYSAYAGFTNSNVFLNRPVGTWMYKGPRASGQQNVGGVTSYNVTHALSFSRLAWNFEVLPGTGTPSLVVYNDGSSTYRYPLVDFSQLFLN